MLGRVAFRLAGGDVATTDVEERHRLRLWQRRVVATVTSACAGIAAALAATIWGRRIGLMFGALLAFEPFLVAHSKILHTDALTASFFIVGVLAAAAAARGKGGVLWDLAAAAASLAGLSKLPGLACIPVAVLLMAGAAWRDTERRASRGWLVAARALVVPLGRFLLVGVAVVLLVWPVAWAAPQVVLSGLARGMELGSTAH
jgi:4-amino-4-deoxy-L-arabinose transferase-like glycosyltransferase